MAAADHFETVQQLYIAFYQRPADSGGLLYWSQRLNAANGSLVGIIDAFATSLEATSLYGPINSTNIGAVVDSIYQALFKRAPDTAGKAFYVNGFTAGTFTAGSIALDILKGAQNEDLVAIQNKVIVASHFTEVVDGRPLNDPDFGIGTDFAATYEGSTDAAAARTMLAAVTSNPATVLTSAQVAEEVKTSIADSGDPILNEVTQTFTLTTGTDALPATAGADTVIGQLGALTTLQASDQIYGNDGSDTLRVVTDGSSAQAVSGFKLESVETVEVQSGATGGTTLGLARADAALAAVRSSGSTSSVTIDGLSKLVAAEIANTTGTALTLNYASAATTGTTTTQGLAVNAANATFNAAGVEIVNVAATGANTLAFGTAPATINVSGAGSLDLGALTATTTTINASANTGGVKATAGAAATATVTGGSGADEFNVSAVTGDVVVSAGAGNDTITATAGLTATDSIAGGDGQDTLVTTGTVADAVLAKVTSVETVQASGALTVTLGANAKAAGVTAVKADGANGLSVTTATGFDGALAVTAGTGANTVNNAGNATLTVTGTESSLAGANLTGGTGNDTLVVTATSAAALDLSGVTGFETVTVLPNATTAGTAVKLVLGANTVAAGKTLTINASALSATGATLEVDTSAVPATATVVVVGGAQADTITGGASKHNLNGGAGDDVFDFSGTTLNADTTINGGDGADTLKMASVTAAALANVSNVENLALTTNASLNANISFTSFDLGAVDSGQELTLATGYTNATTVKLGQAGDKIINNANVALTVNSTVTAANATGAVQGGTGTDVLNLSGGGSLALASNIRGIEVINLADRGDAAPGAGVTNDRGVDYTITTGNYASDATVTTVLTINGADLDAGVLDADGVMISGSDEVVTVDAALIANSKVAVSVTGGGAADQITGGAGNDTILGGAGNDVINVGGGNNAVNGGDGDDAITATATGNNLLLGGAGNDAFVLNGALTGEDSIDGGAGVNSLQVNAGTTNLDFLNVYNVQTLKLATASTTTLGANAQAAGINRVEGHSGNDIINAAAFTRGVTFVSGTGNDSLTGGTADDVFAFSATQLDADDTLVGGTGADTIRLDNASSSGVGSAVTATLTNVSGIERVVINDLSKTTDTAGDVSVTVNTAMTFVGNALTIDGSSLDLGETLTVSASTLVADGAETTTTNEAQHLSVIGGAGSDSITAGGGNDTLIGGSGADSIVGGAGVDSISGGDGRDYLSGGTGNDTIDGGNGTDILIGGAGKDLLTGGAGGDTFVFEAVSESAGEGADVITDFVSGTDKIFVNTSATTSSVVFKGNAANFEAAQALLLVGEAGAVYNQGTKTLWIDANRDGTLNANDLQIVLQNGPVALVGADVTSGVTSPTASSLVTWAGTLADYAAAKANLETEDTVTIIDTAANINGSLGTILADAKIDRINAAATTSGSAGSRTQASNDTNPIYVSVSDATAENAAKFIDGNDVLVVRDTAEKLQALTTETITNMKLAGADRFDSLSNALSLSVAQANAMGSAYMTDADAITVVDTASAIQALIGSEITALANVDTFDSSDNTLSLTVAKAIAMGSSRMTAADVVTVADTGSAIADLTASDLTGLANVDKFDASTALSLTVAQAQAMGSDRMTAADTVTVADTGSAIAGRTAAEITALANVDKFDASTALSLTVAQAQAMGSDRMTDTDSVTVADTGAAIAALSAAQITALANVDKFDASTAMTLTLAQAQAMGVKQETTDTVTVTASGSAVAALTTTQVSDLATWGTDTINLDDNQATMSESAYAAFKTNAGSMAFASGDRVTIQGAVGGNTLNFGGGDVTLTYTSGAQASIVTFDDQVTPTALADTDLFNLSSVDLITTFDAGDKINLAAFGLSGQAQLTDFTTDFSVLRDGSYLIVNGTWTAGAGTSGSFAASSSGTDSLVLFDANTGTGNTAINMVGVVVDQAVLSITDLILV